MMFYRDTDSNLVFIESSSIKVFPCGRRKSELVETGATKQYIPIDPEARLNTEANNRKHSGLNGYKQEYLNYWNTNGELSLVLAGYLFNIKLAGNYSGEDSPNSFGNKIAELLGDTSAVSIYANILTTNVRFFTSVDGSNNTNSAVSTEILRDQTLRDEPSACLDLPQDPENAQNASDFYFSGLSFSAKPLEDIKTELAANQHPVSLLILTKDSDDWHIYEASRLPKIDHGDTYDSVRIPGDLVVDGNIDAEGDVNVGGTLTASDVMIGDMKSITLEVVQTHKASAGVSGDRDRWQLCFNNAKISSLT